MDTIPSSAPRSRTVNWHDPAIPLKARRTESGLSYLRNVIAGVYPAPPIAHLMDMRLAEVERGRVVFETTPAEFHYNPLGIVHGGLAATLLDSAMGCAVHTCLEAGDLYTTLELKLNYLKPMTLDTGLVRGIATIVHISRTIALAEARALDRHDVIYAHGTSTCLIRRAEPKTARG
jgi:uncharacterized protein (TIGR00369 family)